MMYEFYIGTIIVLQGVLFMGQVMWYNAFVLVKMLCYT